MHDIIPEKPGQLGQGLVSSKCGLGLASLGPSLTQVSTVNVN
jgi:hypothetical protein